MLGKMSNETETQELTLGQIVEGLQDAANKLDVYTQAVVAEGADQIVRARLTQCLVLAGTSLEILNGLAVAATAAGSDNDIDEKDA